MSRHLAQDASALNFESDETDPVNLHHAPEWKERQREQSRGTQEQIVAVEVISTIDEGRPGEHLHAALPVRWERLPACPLQRGLACDPGIRRSRARPHRLRAVGRCCSIEASLATAVKTRHTMPQARVP